MDTVIIGSFLSPNYISHKFTSFTSTDSALLLKFFSGPINVRSHKIAALMISLLDTILYYAEIETTWFCRIPDSRIHPK